jgi:DNA-binding transcriptional LysR family regulator
MELRHLRYFVAVAEEQNVTRAAARLHVSQPPLTRQIHDLEQELGVALFDRSGKSIHLNEAGRVFLAAARTILKSVDDGIKATRAIAAGREGELHIGYAPSPTVEILPKLLRAFRKAQPRVRVVLHDHSSPEMLAGLRDGRLQAAVMMQPSKHAALGIVFAPLQAYAINVAVAPRHPFACRRSVSLEELRAEPLAAYARKEFPDYHHFLERIVGCSTSKLRIGVECDSGPSLIAAVESGNGVCICASVFALTAGKRLKFLPVVPAPAPAIVGVAHRRANFTAAARLFVEIAKAWRSTSG